MHGLLFLKRSTVLALVVLTLLMGILVTLAYRTPGDTAPPQPSHPPGPPWFYGSADARFTLIEYADLECPYCRDHLPALLKWVNAHPNVRLQWHHLPLSMHEPAASQEAKIVECAGEANGHEGFWKAVTWIYQHTRGAGQGLPMTSELPNMSKLQSCLESQRPENIVREQTAQATQDRIAATPTLRLIDQKTGKAMMLFGPIQGDALLSALDLFSAPESPATGE